MEIVFLLIGLAAGIAIGFSIHYYKSIRENSQLLTQHLILEENHSRLTQTSKTQDQKLIEREKEVIDLKIKFSTKEVEFKNIEEKLKDQKKQLEEIQEKFTTEFKNIANEILEDKSKRFTEQNKLNISELLNPLKEKIISFEKRVDESAKETLTWNSALKEQLTSLKELNQKITKEAENLTKALKGESKVQGNWGEVILERLLEKSGLVKNQEYSVQSSISTQDGKRIQPDVIIHLPENKKIIIDSKVSLVAYERYCSTDDEMQREKEAKDHIQSIRNHIKALGAKNYHQEYSLVSLDFVLLFIPIEPAFNIAIQKDATLFNEAFEKNVVIVSTSTLLATLRTIASIWRQEYQNRNVLEIAKQSGDLYDKFVGFVDDLLEIGKKINSVQASYESAKNKLYEGKGNLINRAENIKKLGAKTTKSLPPSLLIENKIDDEIL